MPGVLVFDMGGVLYDFQGDRLIAEHSRRKRRWRSEEVQQFWSGLARDFETGAATDVAFAEAVVHHYDLTLAPSEFLLAFRAAAAGFYPGAIELLAELRAEQRVVSLSNTNAVQWAKLLEDLGAPDPFHAHCPSHLSGFHKPDPRAFAALTATLGDAGSEYYFLDDRTPNVSAAREFGWRAQRVRGVAEARSACVEWGFLS
jgi:HAD superfamily hydrolase (TIGR01509 family)